MENKVLVAYATVHGSTQEIAGVIAETMRSQGLEVDVLPARNVRSLENYSAVVLGAPLYMFRWHKEAKQFLNRLRGAITQGIPVAIFAGGPFGESKEEGIQQVRKNLDSEVGKFTWLTPISVELVGGRFDPAALRFPYNLIPAMKQLPPSDLRDWDAIRAWATGLIEKIRENQSA
jgi:menaquinone-dependent protoporphyrinogen oxidase